MQEGGNCLLTSKMLYKCSGNGGDQTIARAYQEDV